MFNYHIRNRPKNNNTTWMLVGALFLANLFLWVSAVEIGYGLPKLLKYIISCTALSLIIIYRLHNQKKLYNYRQLLKPVILFLILWTTYLLLTSYGVQQKYINLVFAGRYYFIPFVIPIIFLFTNVNVSFFGMLLKSSYHLSIIGIIIQLYFLAIGIQVSDWFNIYQTILIFHLGSILLLLTSHLYYKKKYLVTSVINNLLLLIILMICGRRGLALEIILAFTFFVFVRTYSSSIKSYHKMTAYFCTFFIIFFLLLNFNWIQSHFYIFERGVTYDSMMYSRGTVWDDFFYDFKTVGDWLFGRGLNGTVLRTINMGDFGKTIETGYLYMILKGGLFYLIPILILFIRSSYLGFFKSNNDLSKALSLLIILHLFNMAAFGLPDFSSKYMLVWIAVSTCFSPMFRNISNAEVRRILNRNYKIIRL